MITKDMLEHRHDLDYLNCDEDFLDWIIDKICFIGSLWMTIILDLCLFPAELFYYFYKKRK